MEGRVAITLPDVAAGIPGTVGAMPIQNVGAYGQETFDTLVKLRAWDWQENCEATLRTAECGLGHRTSIFERSRRWTIPDLTFALTRSTVSAPVAYPELAKALDVPIGSQLPTRDVVSSVLAIRRRKGMVLDASDPDTRSVGSIFLRPIISAQQTTHLRSKGASPHNYSDGVTRVGASWLLAEAGYRLGQLIQPRVRFSTKHFTLVAEASATATAFATAAALLRDHVSTTTGVTLTFEPDLIGHDPTFNALVVTSPEPKRNLQKE